MVVFADFLRRHRLRLAVGAVILVCLLALGFLSLGIGRGDLASAVPASAEQTSSPRDPDIGDASAWTLKNAIERDLIRRSAEQGIRKPRDPAPTCGEPLVLVDRSHALPQGYAPGDLVSLRDYGIPTVGARDLMLRREAAEHLEDLIAAAASDGEELVVASAFRSYADQSSTYERLKSIYGSGADAISATPGHSQHQLGTAVDFTNSLAAYQVQPVFGQTTAAWWLQNRATEYGFALSYPPGKNETGYDFEPWHYRYIGVENAARLVQSDLTLQEFLVREGVLPDC